MGRIRSKTIKKLAEELVRQHPDKFNDNFTNNKQFLDQLKLIDDIPIRNKVAGYIVRVVEKRKY